jgi:hypothetical protein
MTEEKTNQQDTKEVKAHGEHKVEITVDNKPHHVYPGPYVISTLKEIVHVPASDVLEKVVDGKPSALEDTATIDIKGGEVFISRMREHKVEVTVDNKPHHVYPGPYVVSTFKEIVKVPATKVLEQVVGGEPKLLDDSATIEIKGGEIFFAHVRTGGSSR